MTYENVVEWIHDNLSFDDFDNFEDFLAAADDEFRNPVSSFLPDTYLDELRQEFELSKADIEDNETDH